MKLPKYRIICADGKEFDPTEARCVGSVAKARSREIHDDPVIGEFPVCVEQHGSYRMFTYNRKIKSIETVGA